MNALVIFLLISGSIQIEVNGNENLFDKMEITEPIVVYVNGNIGESTAFKFSLDMENATNTGQSIIPIVISSYGGSVYALLDMMDVIDRTDAIIATIIVGKAMSAGLALATCGDEGMRYASRNSTIMIHEVSSSTGGKIGIIKADVKETERLNKLMFKLMSINIRKSKNYLQNIIHTKGHVDWFLTAKEAKKHNIINHIGMPKFKLDIRIKESLVLE